jgi:hypothetical protein
MPSGLRSAIVAVVTAALVAAAFLWQGTPAAIQVSGGRAARTSDGKPNLNGIWQSLNSANWDLLDHGARQGPVFSLGASFSAPAGLSVVEGNEIPYKPEALAKKKENQANWAKLDPEIKCYMPGVPRANYQGFPFQILQTPQYIHIAYEFASAYRAIYMDPKKSPPGIDMWMGFSRGHWEGDTLVVDVTGFSSGSWFDRAGDFHSDALHVTERYTLTDADHINYEATIEDPNVFTRPWKISMPLYRRVEKNAQLLEYKCPEFAEELLYGDLRKQPGK